MARYYRSFCRRGDTSWSHVLLAGIGEFRRPSSLSHLNVSQTTGLLQLRQRSVMTLGRKPRWSVLSCRARMSNGMGGTDVTSLCNIVIKWQENDALHRRSGELFSAHFSSFCDVKSRGGVRLRKVTVGLRRAEQPPCEK